MLTKRHQIYQFKVTLRDIEPAIWRRIQVPAAYSFWDLHVAIQDSMGWQDYHLHEFNVMNFKTGDAAEIGIPDDEAFEDDSRLIPSWEAAISDYFLERGARADYVYDFGDDWEHDVVLEDIVARIPRSRYPKCLAGARACPPEDCGGIGGYENILRVIRDPSDEEHASVMEWLGGRYEPDTFDPSQVRFDNPKKRWARAFPDR